jgi:hypothetical protein
VNISLQNTGETLSVANQQKLTQQVRSIVFDSLVQQKRSGGLLK